MSDQVHFTDVEVESGLEIMKRSNGVNRHIAERFERMENERVAELEHEIEMLKQEVLDLESSKEELEKKVENLYVLEQKIEAIKKALE